MSKRKRCTLLLFVAVPLVTYRLLSPALLPYIPSILRLPYRPVSARQAERMAERILRSKTESIRPKFVGESGRSKVHNIFWLHIQKCGTSLFNTLWLHFSPNILAKHPNLAYSKDLMETDLIKEYPMNEWCGEQVMFYNYPRVGLHWPYKDAQNRKDGRGPQRKEYHSFAMFRNPLERIKSAFSFRETTMTNVPFYSRLNDPNVSLEDYAAEPQIPNCQIKMVLGHRCQQEVEPSKLDVKKALERIASPSFYFGLTDRWDESMCLFHSWYGGSTRPFELLNNRPTKRLDGAKEEDIDIESVDTAFVAGAAKIFEQRLKKAGCLASG